jgi:phosphomannomutase
MAPMTLEELVHAALTWRDQDPDPETAAELTRLIENGDEAELRDRFAGRLAFGTAGLRGVLGAGPNRMNRAVVRQTAAGLCRYLLAHAPEATRRGVVVGHDARRQSRELAHDSAAVLAAHGIPAHIFSEAVPTPLCAFAIGQLGAVAGVVVTASHNPPEYNGYKVYWTNGAQIIPPHDTGIAAEIGRGGPAAEVPLLDAGDAARQGLWHQIGAEMGREYVRQLLALRLSPGVGTDLRIVYTALHGVGGRWVREVLGAAGFTDVHAVAEQQEPDGGFPTVRFPNPEEPGALDLSNALAERVGAELVLANDPDADRLAVLAREHGGALRALTGNEIGVLLGHYLLTRTPAAPGPPLVVTTIVSSAQLGKIAAAEGARYDETLTGFRWISNRAMEIEREEAARFLFGYEEALGYTVGTVVRDKDGVGAALVFADLAGYCRSQGLTVLDYLEEVQRRFGLYLSCQRSFRFPGTEGSELMSRLMQALRDRPPERLGGEAVVVVKDYERGLWRESGAERTLGLPASNVIAFELANGSRVTVRPSGTEPKLKYYFELCEELGAGEPLQEATARGGRRLDALVEATIAAARERGQPG